MNPTETDPDTETGPSLLVFSDDWGRHASSCQHLIRELLPRYDVTWVNTIGTRAPRLDIATLKRVMEKLRQWSARPTKSDTSDGDTAEPDRTAGAASESSSLQPRVVNPRMWPWFSGAFDRGVNRRLLARQLTPIIEAMPQPVIGLTTLPITADLPDVLPVSRWVYYCVDDFSQWPGLDGKTLRRMDADMIRRADEIVVVSETLRTMVAGEGRSCSMLTHGVDVDFWNVRTAPRRRSVIDDIAGPCVVFWGVIDPRLCLPSLKALSSRLLNHRKWADARIVLVGPQQDPDPSLFELPNVVTRSAQPLAELPAIAADAAVLIMPYADLPVTRAMQPLKLKEYLATGRPVVVNDLPAIREWQECMDVARSPDDFADLVIQNLDDSIPLAQQSARQRLRGESWNRKSQCLEQILLHPMPPVKRRETDVSQLCHR
ncbi:MAG: glycosyltransferase [Planctomycetaceae bacterium]|nr:glycosyltransferase [Planctomycetaceae bacterium]